MHSATKRVYELFDLCLFHKLPGGRFIPVMGSIGSNWFDVDRINQYECEIKRLLSELPETFYGPHGCHVKQACFNRSGKEWMGEYAAEKLLMLGVAAGWCRKNGRFNYVLLRNKFVHAVTTYDSVVNK